MICSISARVPGVFLNFTVKRDERRPSVLVEWLYDDRQDTSQDG
jgi:hypothetical protein